MIKTEIDQQIVEAIMHGRNDFVLNYLYKTSLPIIIRYITKNSGDEEEAKDIFQDAVVALYTTVKLGRFEIGKEVNGFLFAVARNLWINRAKKKNLLLDIDHVPIDLVEDSPVVSIISDEKKRAIDDIMDKIGAKCKEILNYVMYENMSMKEIAKAMNLSDDNVAKTTHYRCKKKIIEIVENDKKLLELLKG